MTDEEIEPAEVNESEDKENEEEGPVLCQSTREKIPVSRIDPQMSGQTHDTNDMETSHNMTKSPTNKLDEDVRYSPRKAVLIACLMVEIKEAIKCRGTSFAQQYFLQKGLKVFGREEGKGAAMRELDQLHKRNCFAPMKVS